MSEPKTFTYKEIAEHNTADDLWIIINDKVYNCTKFIDEHPGGDEVIIDLAAKDATKDFADIGHSDDAIKFLKKLYVGDVDITSEKVETEVKAGTETDNQITKGNGRLALAIFIVVVSIVGYLLHKS
ncbi:related to Cytochrome b5 [Saccharomycodes ludwigii]|uniref:Related to Cytochrome b5 n=1 Tax=Saccharomycodes ludwigii TaxID=36035 RepID=A0A376B359_9ASCO|nr:hypothetical protein SCDLUD_002900 [Saccharomycodes ludwigii]KAH3901408.1 hypothetical protein SCDLUD_002900 [Saccharomycodes ludwigii]SSD59128.1 related to Cytochrome b5 [Saccharomycodes ludwigii]